MRLENLLTQTRLEPRPYQIRLVKKTTRLYDGTYKNGAGNTEPPHRYIMVESPTGSGKTPIALLTARLMQENHGALVGWTCMRRNLLTQAANENAAPSTGNPRGKAIGTDVSFFSMFTRDLPRELLPENRKGRKLLLVVDEGHHDAANTSIHIHNELQPDWILGTTATPYRTDKVKLCFEKVIRDIGIRELIDQGYLSPYDHYSIPNWEPETVADFFAANPTQWAPALVFFHQQHHCRRFYRRLTEHHGIPSDVVTGNTDREAQTAALAHGEVLALANCAVLTEGFDFPDLRTCFVRDSGRGCTIQMGGRVFRKSDIWERKQIVQSGNTLWPFIKTALPKQQNVWKEDRWLSLTINPKMEQVSRNATFMIAHTPMQVPEYIRARAGKKRRHHTF